MNHEGSSHLIPGPRPELLAAQGAVMSIAGSPAQHYLVGDFAWVGPRYIYWFAANGDTTADAQALKYEVMRRDRNSVQFLRGGLQVASIALIDDAEVDDPDDFRIGWQIWQQVAPMRRALLERCRREHAAAAERDVSEPEEVSVGFPPFLGHVVQGGAPW